MELSQVIPQVEAGVSIRRARVLAVDGRTLTVDMGGPLKIPSLDSCNPVPGQWVYILGDGSSMTAIGAIGGVWRQSAVTVTSVSETAVGGLVNGSPFNITKMGAFTPAVGDTLPLIWSASGDSLWAGPKPGVPYVPPPPPSGGGGGGGGGVTSGTETYAATSSGTWSVGRWWLPDLGHNATSKGCFFYGDSRFRGLQGRTITGFRISAAPKVGASTVSYYTHPHPSMQGEPALSNGPVVRSDSGWQSLPISMANWLIAGSGTGGIGVFGLPAGTTRGMPYGTLQFDWRK